MESNNGNQYVTDAPLVDEFSKLQVNKGTFPVKTKQFAAKIVGIVTEFIVSVFSDYIFILITQNGKPGTIVRETPILTTDSDSKIESFKETGEMFPTGGDEESYGYQTLLGKREDPILEIYSRQLIEKISKSATSCKPVIFSISLEKQPSKEEEKKTFNCISKILMENKIW
jgi:hypothetical protein